MLAERLHDPGPRASSPYAGATLNRMTRALHFLRARTGLDEPPFPEIKGTLRESGSMTNREPGAHKRRLCYYYGSRLQRFTTTRVIDKERRSLGGQTSALFFLNARIAKEATV